jgi:hypothetical protein
MNICENCNCEHDGEYGSGRFCSNKCARGFSTKANRFDINKKISNSLKLPESVISERTSAKHAAFIAENEVTSIMDLSKRTITKVLKRMKLSCSKCGWYHEGAVGDLHHIVERKNGGSDDNSNLTYICPNCHRLVHSGIIKSEELVSLQDYIGDEWKKHYYVKDSKLYVQIGI